MNTSKKIFFRHRNKNDTFDWWKNHIISYSAVFEIFAKHYCWISMLSTKWYFYRPKNTIFVKKIYFIAAYVWVLFSMFSIFFFVENHLFFCNKKKNHLFKNYRNSLYLMGHYQSVVYIVEDTLSEFTRSQTCEYKYRE